MKKKKVYLEIFTLFVVLHVLLYGLENIGYCIMGADNRFINKMITMCAMGILSIGFILYSKMKKQPLSFWPEHFTRKYWIVSLIVVVLFLSNPSLYVDTMKAVLLLIYGSIVTPLFEELVFRGYVWNRLEGIYEKPTTIMVLNAVLFGVWHLGYIITPLMNGEWMALSKLVIGFAFGMILGFVRMKTKNCYSTFLVHGLLNSFL